MNAQMNNTLQNYFKAKEESWKFEYFTMQNITLKKKPSTRKTKNPSRYYYNSIITNLSSFNTKPKYHLSKILI
jgi:hypothetical protein